MGEGFSGWLRLVEERGHSLVVTRGEEVPLLSYCLLCGKYAEKAGQGLKEGCKGKPKNKMAKYRLKRMTEGKHPEVDRKLGGRVPGKVWESTVGPLGKWSGGGGECVAGGVVKEFGMAGLPWDAGSVQGGASGSGNLLFFLEPCGAGASGSDSFCRFFEPCGAGASGSGGGTGSGPCGAGASGYTRVGRLAGWTDPCGAGASGAVGVWPWEPDSGHGGEQPEAEEVAGGELYIN